MTSHRFPYPAGHGTRVRRVRRVCRVRRGGGKMITDGPPRRPGPLRLNLDGIGTNKLVAIGKWVIAQETVKIDWKEQRFEGKEKAFFAKYHGLCERLVLYLSFDTKKTVRGVYLVSKEKDGEKIECPLWRTKEYPDWEKIKNELKKG